VDPKLSLVASTRGKYEGRVAAYAPLKLNDFDAGFMIGLLVGEGHFGGDQVQPHVNLKMHTDHYNVFKWVTERFRFGELYGPYEHDHRHYYLWMARGEFLRQVMGPFLDQYLRPEHSQRVWDRYQAMKSRYKHRLDPELYR
jgi:hypothetical protein